MPLSPFRLLVTLMCVHMCLITYHDCQINVSILISHQWSHMKIRYNILPLISEILWKFCLLQGDLFSKDLHLVIDWSNNRSVPVQLRTYIGVFLSSLKYHRKRYSLPRLGPQEHIRRKHLSLSFSCNIRLTKCSSNKFKTTKALWIYGSVCTRGFKHDVVVKCINHAIRLNVKIR